MQTSTMATLEQILDGLESYLSERDDSMEAMRKRAISTGDDARAQYARGYQLGMDEAMLELKRLIKDLYPLSERVSA